MIQYNELLNEIAKIRKFSGNTEVVPIFALHTRFLSKRTTVFRTDATGRSFDCGFNAERLSFTYPFLWIPKIARFFHFLCFLGTDFRERTHDDSFQSDGEIAISSFMDVLVVDRPRLPRLFHVSGVDVRGYFARFRLAMSLSASSSGFSRSPCLCSPPSRSIRIIPTSTRWPPRRSRCVAASFPCFTTISPCCR